jgi:hypothetical protein
MEFCEIPMSVLTDPKDIFDLPINTLVYAIVSATNALGTNNFSNPN